jgi:hypothetical protein
MADSGEKRPTRSRRDTPGGSRSRHASPDPALSRVISGGTHLDDHSQYHGHLYHGPSEESLEDSTSEEIDLPEKEQEIEDADLQDGDIVPEVRGGIEDQRDVEKTGEKLEKSRTTKSGRSVRDSNLVTWDGLDDPENPKNWKMSRKWAATFVGKYLLLSSTCTIADSRASFILHFYLSRILIHGRSSTDGYFRRVRH